jgi:RimJ/RimL family protein N-acetyltransferase
MNYVKKIIGEKCYLAPAQIENAEKFAPWLSDIQISKGLTITPHLISVDVEKKIIQSLIDGPDKVFSIVSRDNDELLGGCGLSKINYISKSAELGIFIGDTSCHGKGIGTEACRLLCDYAFNILNLNNVMLLVHEYNKNAIRSYEKAGFKVIGRRREAQLIAGKKYDIIYMDIIASEFESPYVNKFFS